MKICPECGVSSHDEFRCGLCDSPFDVPGESVTPATSQAARSVDEVARTLGVKSDKATSGTFVEVTLPPGQPPVALEIVPRTEEKRRTWLLLVLLVAVAFYFVDQGRERRAEQRVRTDTAAQQAEPTIDAAYLDLAFESMLSEAREISQELEEEDAAAAQVDRLLSRVTDLSARLKRARIETSKRAAYAEALDALGAFLRDDVRPATDADNELDNEPDVEEASSNFNLDVAEAAFGRARAR